MRLVSFSLCRALQKEEVYFISVNCNTEELITLSKDESHHSPYLFVKIHCCSKSYTADKLETFKIVFQ